MRIAVVAAAVALLVAGCHKGGGEVVTGAIPGANPGIVVGSPVSSGTGEPTVGAVEGGLTGADVGQSLSDADRKLALKAEYEALEYGHPGQPTTWQSKSGSTNGSITVGSSYQVNRLECREYTHQVLIGGRARVVRGTACREPDGVWRIVG